ncbi:lycopene cyclase family protein [Streptomyces sp. NPDC059740]|uniref:lycopene cyclase family protein n=1 Tax=Streptomyces sp. NPDC059740 TaxID=3346926 RepID=UPI003659F0DE
MRDVRRTPRGTARGDVDVVIVGAGAAGLSLAHHLAAPPPGLPRPTVALLDAPPGPLRPPERTWCYWEAPGGPWDTVLAASWERLRLRRPDGRAVEGRPSGLRYKMLRSTDFAAQVSARIEGTPGFRRTTATVETVLGHREHAEVHGTDAGGRPVTLRARWVFDSRPPPTLPPARTTLLQHFRGWFVRTRHPAFDPGTADLMDFRTPQPAHGLSFAYVLPLNTREALVEYTEFGPTTLTGAGYDAALRHHLHRVLGLGGYEVRHVEGGVIPMTDARFPRNPAPRVFRIGTAGGATRPATGYTFAAVQRQSRAVAALLHHGRTPHPPPPHRARSRAMDAVLLRALDRGRVDGAAFFCDLFDRVPTEQVLRFLDGESRPVEDLRIGLRTPVAPMLRTTLELPWLRRRTPPPPPPHPAPAPPPPAHRPPAALTPPGSDR